MRWFLLFLAAIGATAWLTMEAEQEEPPQPTRATRPSPRMAPEPRRPLRPPRPILWAVGDGDESATSESVVRLIRAGAPTRFLYLGDVYGPYRTRYVPTWGALAPLTAPTPGEEEWDVPEYPVESGASPEPPGNEYLSYWSTIHGRRQRPYYSFRLAGWEIVSLNSPLLRAGDTRQLGWLRDQVSEPGTCRIVFAHHGWQSASPFGFSSALRAVFDVLAGRAVLFLNADDHSMQRFRPFGGVTQLVAGTGGNGLHPVRRRGVPGLVWAANRDYGAIRIILGRSRADFQFVSVEGETLHDGQVRCSPLR